MRLIGVEDDSRFATFAGRVEHREELDAIVDAWIGARPASDVLDAFATAEAAIAPVMDMAAIAADPHVAATGMIAEIDGTPMQGLVARLAATPGRLRWAGKDIDADGDDIRARGWD